jgi:aspartate aminotransferase-like enzyme
MKRSNLPKYYFDLGKALAAYSADDTPWTPAVSLIIGTDVALEMIRHEGVESVWRRHARLAGALRAGIVAAGLRLYSSSPSDSVTAVVLPGNVEWKRFNELLVRKFGIVVAGGQDRAKGKIFRISHLGYYDELDMVAVMSAVERALPECGFAVVPGSGVTALQDYFVGGRK